MKCSRISLQLVSWYWKIGIETFAADPNTLTENRPNSVKSQLALQSQREPTKYFKVYIPYAEVGVEVRYS